MATETYVRPEITAERDVKYAVEGTKVNLKCYPRNPNAVISIRWYRENLTLPLGALVSDGVVTISNAQQSDSGRYYCEINSKEGSYSNYVDLIVTSKLNYGLHHFVNLKLFNGTYYLQ